MSNPTTYYNVGGIDLSNIFQPYSSGALARATGYRILGGQDLLKYSASCYIIPHINFPIFHPFY